MRIALYLIAASLFFIAAGRFWYSAWALSRQMHDGSGGIGAVSIGIGTLLIDLLIPLAANLIAWRPARRSRVATLLRRVHLIALALAVYATVGANLLLSGVMGGAQFALLGLVYLVIAVQSPATNG